MALVDVIKYDGTPNVFAWKHPNSELGTWTQLIVNETQEAVLYKGGQSLDLFGAGRHTLDTANIPILSKLINLPFGGKSPFSAEVWFINKVNALDIKWGTPTPIQIQDPKYNVFIPLRAFGQFGIKIQDSKMFLNKLVGTLPTFNADDILKYFRGVYLTKVKDDLSGYLIKKRISILEINAYINEISENLKDRISPTFEEYGIELVNFYVNDISVPENDESVKKLKTALSKKAEMDIVGYSYTQERSFDTLEGAAKNEGSNAAQFMGAGIGLGMGMGLGGNIGQSFGNMANNINTTSTKECPHCKKQIGIDFKFCPECGNDTSVANAMKCPKCGGINPVGTKFCCSCGNPMLKVCSKCGEMLNDNEKFCHNCGTPAIRKCECGHELSGNLKFCPECGRKVNGDENE